MTEILECHREAAKEITQRICGQYLTILRTEEVLVEILARHFPRAGKDKPHVD